MSMELSVDVPLVNEIAARFDLRKPNQRALQAVVDHIAGEHEGTKEVVADLATGVGKTFLMSSLIDYVAAQGVRHVLVVTPGTVIQEKTLANFDEASAKYVAGADHQPYVITPDNFRTSAVGTALRDPDVLKVFVFNIHQLIAPGKDLKRKTRTADEVLGEALYDYLLAADGLLVIADESHLYHEKAKQFSAAIRELHPFALVGLTATPAKSDEPKVVFRYSLGEAIAEEHVKVPVIVYRRDGTKDERTQLQDACTLLRQKESAYAAYREATPDAPVVKPVLFVVAASIQHCGEVGQILAGADFIGDPEAVLEITSDSSDEALAALAAVEAQDSKIRAIVSVNKLREGWDVGNIAVIVALRRLASQSLTEQILGRGLRLPFRKRTGVPMVDQVDLVAHDSYRQLLAQKNVLLQRIESTPPTDQIDDTGAATTAGEGVPVPSTEVPVSEQPAQSDATLPHHETGEQGPGPTITWHTPGDDDEEDGGQGLLVIEDEETRQKRQGPLFKGRLEGAPQITFPRRESRMTYAAFTLSDIPNGDAEQAGARFVREVPSFLQRDALEVQETLTGEQQVTVSPQRHVEAQQALTGIDTIREDLAAAILRQVTETREEKNAARRLVKAFLKGSGVTSDTHTASWGENRRQHAISGISDLIGARLTNRKREMTYELVPVTLPIEPVSVDPGAMDAYSDAFAKHVQFVGWQKNVMPLATFDAGSTEWALGHLLDRDPDIAWWLRIYTNGPAFIPTESGNYFPDFIALDTAGAYWVIEGKSDKNSIDADVLRKREAAERWARAVNDNDQFGEWHYVFASESHIKAAAGSWEGLKVVTNPE